MLRRVVDCTLHFADGDSAYVGGEHIIGLYTNDYYDVVEVNPIGPVTEMKANYVYIEAYLTVQDIRTAFEGPTGPPKMLQDHFKKDKDFTALEVRYQEGHTHIYLAPWDSYASVNQLIDWDTSYVGGDRVRITLESENYVE